MKLSLKNLASSLSPNKKSIAPLILYELTVSLGCCLAINIIPFFLLLFCVVSVFFGEKLYLKFVFSSLNVFV